MSQAQLQRAHVVVPSGNAPNQPPPYGPGSSVAQYTMSPIAPATGHKTTGLVFLVAATSVSAVELYARDPHTGIWGLVASFSAAPPNALAVFKWASVCDLLASEIWFRTDASSDFALPTLILVEETSG